MSLQFVNLLGDVIRDLTGRKCINVGLRLRQACFDALICGAVAVLKLMGLSSLALELVEWRGDRKSTVGKAPSLASLAEIASWST